MLVKIFQSSSTKEKLSFFTFIFLSIVTSLLDLLSISLLIPIIKLVLSGSEEYDFNLLGKDWSIDLTTILFLLFFFFNSQKFIGLFKHKISDFDYMEYPK